MDWRESIEIVKNAQENNRLVIFVGAGISGNSNVPTWNELISAIAARIHYLHCETCNKQGHCTEENRRICAEKKTFDQNEYLRIPEYFYQSVEDPEEYYSFIRNFLGKGGVSNPINEEIYRVLPHHIITTNYDTLMEDARTINSSLYTKITKDEDLLSKVDDRYLIKMHGDLTDAATIVLRESDYLNYEQKHPLISTFIRSLLVNHTFLFIGYSLGDNNLNLIIGWINYLAEYYGVKERPHNFWLVRRKVSEFEKERLLRRNIDVIELTGIPEDLIHRSAPSGLTNEGGRMIFTYLHCISHKEILNSILPLNEVLDREYQMLQAYRYISREDLIHVHPIGKTYFSSSFMTFDDYDDFENYRTVLIKGPPVIMETLRKTGLTGIRPFMSREYIAIDSIPDSRYWTMYVNNEYAALLEEVRKNGSVEEQLYYAVYFEQPFEEVRELLEKEDEKDSLTDSITVLLQKIRARSAYVRYVFVHGDDSRKLEIKQIFDTLPPRYTEAASFLRDLFFSQNDKHYHMQQILDAQRNHRAYGSGGGIFVSAFDNVLQLQGYAYDYYYFIKRNLLVFDHFKDARRYLSYYIQILLSVSSPTQGRESYRLNEIDLDIIIKFSSAKDLEKWLAMYRVTRIQWPEDADILTKYRNLCRSCTALQKPFIAEQLYNFTQLLCCTGKDDPNRENRGLQSRALHAAVKTCACLLEQNTGLGEQVLRSVVILARTVDPGFHDNGTEGEPRPVSGKPKQREHMAGESPENDLRTAGTDIVCSTAGEKPENSLPAACAELGACLLRMHLRKPFGGRTEERIQKLFAVFSDWNIAGMRQEITERVERIRDREQQFESMFFLRKLLLPGYFGDSIRRHAKEIGSRRLSALTDDRAVNFGPELEKVFLEELDAVMQKQKDSLKNEPSGDFTTVNPKRVIENCVKWKLEADDPDFSYYEPYAARSAYIAFLLDPAHFDYSRTDTSQPLWQQIIRLPAYQRYFIEHRDEVLNPRLLRTFAYGEDTREQQQILFGILLSEEEGTEFLDQLKEL